MVVGGDSVVDVCQQVGQPKNRARDSYGVARHVHLHWHGIEVADRIVNVLRGHLILMGRGTSVMAISAKTRIKMMGKKHIFSTCVSCMSLN